MQVDMVYAPFVERFKDFFAAVNQYDMAQGRPKLKEWIEVRASCMNGRKIRYCIVINK